MGQTTVHPSSVVEDGARLGSNVTVGPFCHVSSQAVIGDGVTLVSHVSVQGATTLGEGCTLHPHAAVGGPAQNLKHEGGPATLVIGRNCIIREGATIHCGTDTSRAATTIGDNGYFMTCCHIGHDCDLGDNVTMASFSSVAGHAVIGDFVNLAGYAAVHQFVRIGHHAFLAGFAAVVGDVIPFGMAIGDRAKLRGLNVVGLKRSGMTRADLQLLRRAYRLLFSRERPFADNVKLVSEQFGESETVRDIIEFLGSRARRQLTVPALKRGLSDDADDID